MPGPVMPPLSEAQMEIMNVVWDRGEATVADVWKVLSARRKLARSTVLTMLTRLEEKGWLSRDEEGHAFRYRAAVPREATLGHDDPAAGRHGVRRLGRGAGPGAAARPGRLEGGGTRDQEDDRSRGGQDSR